MRTPALIVLLASSVAGCGSSSSTSSPQPPASGTGFMAVATAGSTYKLYMPSPPTYLTGDPNKFKAKLAVLNAGAPNGASGLIRYVDLGPEARPWAVGADAQDVVAVDKDNGLVYFVDAATDAVRGTATLPGTLGSIITSDGPTKSAGVAVDAAHRRAYVSVSTGLYQYDLDTRALVTAFDVPPPENFSLDAAAGKLYAPFYLCRPDFPEGQDTCTAYIPSDPGFPDHTDSLTIVDIPSGKGYTLVSTDPANPTPYAPLGLQPDAVALDLSLHVAALAVEIPPAIHVLDLGGVTYDEVNLHCQASGLVVDTPADQYTAIAADAVSHLLVVAQEAADGVFFVDLDKARQGITSTLTAVIPAAPGGVQWFNHGDAHAVTVGVVGDRPYAFLAHNDRNWIARVDLLEVARMMNGGGGTFAQHVSFFSVPPAP